MFFVTVIKTLRSDRRLKYFRQHFSSLNRTLGTFGYGNQR